MADERGADPANEDTLPVAEATRSETTERSVIGHFTLGRQLGAGGMGFVLAAHDDLLDRPVALKLMHPDGAASSERRQRLLREAQALAKLSHPNVVTVHEVGVVGEDVFIAMELVDGSTLRDWMRERRPWREVVAMFLPAGRGLEAAHALGLVHRDFKPSNVLIDKRGAVKVGDFGLVGSVDTDELAEGSPPAFNSPLATRTGAILGTPAYMAPEQRRGQRVDARADQYAFCASLHQALTGKLPEDAGADERARRLPARLRRVLARGLADDRGSPLPVDDHAPGRPRRVAPPPMAVGGGGRRRRGGGGRSRPGVARARARGVAVPAGGRAAGRPLGRRPARRRARTSAAG